MNSGIPEKLSKSRVQENLEAVRSRIDAAAQRSGRKPESVRILGVTKYVNCEIARWLVELGCNELAESRPQLLWEKASMLSDLKVRWHLIGHLQRNKVLRTLPLVTAIHSLDSERLLEQIQKDLGARTSPLEVMLEVNISGDTTKTGITIPEGEKLLDSWVGRLADCPNLRIVGLMGMGGLEQGIDETRRDFEALRLLRNRWAERFGLSLEQLSMGMSDDFEIAIEEGATMVRLGSILFS